MQKIVWKKVKDGYETIEPESNARIKVASFVPLDESQLNTVYDRLIQEEEPLHENEFYEWLIPPGLLQ